ncbi:uncharacterized oxidoreductase YrbE-like [Pecten maximus]|uniref:uncharacterized oxidoreductase YrbE-like n=1 Tax=Pecten maximus TaxID=6579 RepID=UPI0014588D85|nr:uncharacterized oxidoreductase YrbE-like [Pecten maximus]
MRVDNMAHIGKKIVHLPVRNFLARARCGNIIRNVLDKEASQCRIFQRTLCTSSVKNNSTPGSQVSSKQRQYNVGVFGAGRIASSVHIKNILQKRRLNLKWILDDSPAAVSSCKDLLHLHDTPFYNSDDRETLLNDESLDAVFVFTPTETHADYICESLSRGR